jgi:glycosyltransferase involved in cell wall biosynthesis
MTVSIVIRAFNEEQHIDRLLYGITQQTIPNPEIILVDSGSTDNTVAIAKTYPVKVLTILPEEFTFGKSLNQGIAAASGEFVVIISAHCFPVYPDWLEQLIKPFTDPEIGLSYGRQRGGETNYYSEHQFFRKYFPENSVTQQAHPYSHNANAAIRRILWEQHPYNENLTGLEDLAWSSWMMEEGYSIAYVAEAEVIHRHDETLKQIKKRYEREAIAMKQILPNSQFSFWHFLKMAISSTVSDLIQAKHEKVLLKKAGSIIQFRFRQYWGTYQGFHYKGNINPQLHQSFYYPPNILDKKIPKAREITPIHYQDN